MLLIFRVMLFVVLNDNLNMLLSRPLPPQLQCNSENKFKIIQFTDCHFGESESGDEDSKKSFIDLLGYESPDLVSISGDFVSGYAWDSTPGWFKKQFDNGIAPIINSSIPWCYTLGNHDCQADWNRTQVIAYGETLRHSLTQLGPAAVEGASNFVVTVKNRYNGKAVANIWFLDSMQTGCYGATGWGCVGITAVEWYFNMSITLEHKYGRKLPGIMYVHIPMPELLAAYNSVGMSGTLEDSGVCCWALDTGLFAAIKSRGDVVSVWHGHDHNNDFYTMYKNVQIGYGRKTAFGGYGPPDDIPRGARVLQFDCIAEVPSLFQLNLTTWIRENDGTKVVEQPTHPAGGWKAWPKCCGSDGIRNRNLEK